MDLKQILKDIQQQKAAELKKLAEQVKEAADDGQLQRL